MKRFVTILLAFAMLASMGSIAYAEDNYNFSDGDTTSVTIDGKYVASNPETVYCVRVSWKENLTFNYVLEDGRTWLPTTHQYSGGWKFVPAVPDKPESGHRVVEVENRSNSAVDVSATLKSSNLPTGFTLSLNGASTVLEQNESLEDRSLTSSNTQCSFTVYLTSDGRTYTTKPDITENTTVGTLTITVKAHEN